MCVYIYKAKSPYHSEYSARVLRLVFVRYTSYDMRNNTVCIYTHHNPLNFDGTAVVFCKQCSARIVVHVYVRVYIGDNARI